MTKRHGYALLAAVLAVIVVVSAAIYVGVTGAGDDSRDTINAGGRHPRNSAAPASSGTWVGSWSASPAGAEPRTERKGFAGRSIRNVVHTSVGGASARITLSNLYGATPLSITHASIAVASATNDPAAAAGTLRRLTFNGNTSVIIPPGAQVMSDAARLRVPHDSDLLVTTYSPTPSGPVTYHPHARQISYVADGDHTEDPNADAYTEQSPFWRYLTAVDVLSNEADGTVVVLGDSITDGISSTMGANRRWTDVLADRMRDEPGAPRYGVVNQGISGNRVLSDGNGQPAVNPSGLSRFDRDVLDRTGVKAVVIALGVNDILRNPHQNDPDRIVGGLRELTRQAHTRGLRVVGATLMPFGGHRGYEPGLEAVRQSVNEQIRSGEVFDDFVDFDRALRDPYDPRSLRAQYDSGDHLHPSDAGYRKMAQTFDLAHLKGSAAAEL
ncbi:SGNH/GDSL hydrolase family protein [Streptomyces alfalfae]|uniref:SGNH hydrolase n=1 Tax=Streptomyces alfalfae TaxID=1642299 RepID=A0A1P8TKE0_9ACTN|nr:SGNH/GDSL hydrolase family protein [Streptomyces alfalfae]AYA18478.1 SGNH/GDSL hydrolase family protein [Streptomyces fradiae]APY88097.1 SGNH hydrolase [Streptomyces alfalfae]QQC89492.1 SGNH/GDSL hydrolase family protein [Streptomyces alfalfae]QUI31932.1 SGNH/GDSL hydrolase family protein [Streptomyces alfalfae]RXX46642.1 SGNH/GDSL hydrolase family protein [Streptomyces alfalfae]